MIQLTKQQQAKTFLSLIETWEVQEKDDSTHVSRRAAAEVLAYHMPVAAVIFGVAASLRRARREQGDNARHTYWRADFDELAELIGSRTIARLALELLGLWPTRCQHSGEVEWSDCTAVGGARNDIELPEELGRYWVGDIVTK